MPFRKIRLVLPVSLLVGCILAFSGCGIMKKPDDKTVVNNTIDTYLIALKTEDEAKLGSVIVANITEVWKTPGKIYHYTRDQYIQNMKQYLWEPGGPLNKVELSGRSTTLTVPTAVVTGHMRLEASDLQSKDWAIKYQLTKYGDPWFIDFIEWTETNP